MQRTAGRKNVARMRHSLGNAVPGLASGFEPPPMETTIFLYYCVGSIIDAAASVRLIIMMRNLMHYWNIGHALLGCGSGSELGGENLSGLITREFYVFFACGEVLKIHHLTNNPTASTYGTNLIANVGVMLDAGEPGRHLDPTRCKRRVIDGLQNTDTFGGRWGWQGTATSRPSLWHYGWDIAITNRIPDSVNIVI